jgi:hypothetical protein
MGGDEATKFWEFFETMPEKVQLDYMNNRFGELVFDISRDWEDYKIEYDDLKRLKTQYEEQIEEKDFASDTDEERYLQLCEELFALAEDFNRDEHTTESLMLKEVFRDITKKLNEEQQKELQENMDSRGL